MAVLDGVPDAVPWSEIDQSALLEAYAARLAAARAALEAIRGLPKYDSGKTWTEGAKAAVERFAGSVAELRDLAEPLLPGADHSALANYLQGRPARSPPEEEDILAAFALLGQLFQHGRTALSTLLWAPFDRKIQAVFHVQKNETSQAMGYIVSESGAVNLDPKGAAAYVASGFLSAVLDGLAEHVAQIVASKSARVALSKDQGSLRVLLFAGRDRCLLLRKLARDQDYASYSDDEIGRACVDLRSTYELLDMVLGEDAVPARSMLKPLRMEPIKAVRMLTSDADALFVHAAGRPALAETNVPELGRSLVRRVALRLAGNLASDKLILEFGATEDELEQLHKRDASERKQGYGTLEYNERREKAAIKIEAAYRGYRVRKEHGAEIKRNRAATRIKAFWKGSKARRLFKQVSAPWRPLIQPQLSDRRIEFEVEIPRALLVNLLTEDTPIGEPIVWKNVELQLSLRSEPSNRNQMIFEIVSKRPLPAQFSLQVKPSICIIDNKGVQTRKCDGALTVFDQNKRRVTLGVYERELADFNLHPELSKLGKLVVRAALSVNKFEEPPSWTQYNILSQERQRKVKNARAALDKSLAQEAKIKSGIAFDFKDDEAERAKKRDELYMQLAKAPLVGPDENVDKRRVFYAEVDPRPLRTGLASHSKNATIAWKAENGIGFGLVVYGPSNDNENGRWLQSYLKVTDTKGQREYEHLPDNWKRHFEFNMTLMSTRTSVYENKDITVNTHAIFNVEELERQPNAYAKGVKKAFPVHVLEKDSGFVVTTEDGKHEFLIIRVEIWPRDETKKPSATKGPEKKTASDHFAEAEAFSKTNNWHEAVKSVTRAIELDAGNSAFRAARARYNFEGGYYGEAGADITAVLNKTKPGNNKNRLAVQLVRAQIAESNAEAESDPAVLLEFAREGLEAVEEVLKYDGSNKVAVETQGRLVAWRDTAEQLKEEQAKQAEEERAADAKKARQCPDGRNCRKVDCQLEHPNGYRPPRPAAAPPPNPAELRRLEEERKEQAYFGMLTSWLSAIQSTLPEEMPSNDIVKALFPPRGVAAVEPEKEETKPAAPADGSGEQNLEVETLTKEALLKNQVRQEALQRSITGETSNTVARGAGRSSSLRVFATAHTARELVRLDLKDKIRDMFAGRAQWQSQKKVAEGVFEGRTNEKERIFFVELDTNVYLVTAIVLNHKGFNRVIEHSAAILANVREAGIENLLPISDDTEDTEEGKKTLQRIAMNGAKLRSIIFSFRDVTKENPNMGDGYFLPRTYLGNLDMLIETEVDTGRTAAVLTKQEKQAIEIACNEHVSLFIRGSAGNGKTTVLSEIAKSSDKSIIVLPTERLRDQVLRSYPEINAITVRDRLRPLWPSDWRLVNFAAFSAEVQSRKPKATTDEIADMWEDRTSLPWYNDWKIRESLRDELDLWLYYTSALQAIEVPDLVDNDAMEAIAVLGNQFVTEGIMLMDEAQSLTPLQVKLIALSSGRPNHVIVGLDSKQSVGKHSAGRRTGVRAALKDVSDIMRLEYEHATVNLSINFRCPVGVLQVLDSVLTTWLKPYFKDEFDDFAVDAVLRTTLWDSPPVLLCETVAAARKLLAAAGMPFVVLHNFKTPQNSFADMDPLMTLGVNDCRGLEFEELCVLDRPFNAMPNRLFDRLHKNASMTKEERDQVRDAITSWLVLMTRCMFGAIWVTPKHHPVIRKLMEQGRALLMEVNENDQSAIDSAVAMLRRARQSEAENVGGTLLSVLSKIMGIIGDKAEAHRSFVEQATWAAQLIRRITGREGDELELGLLELPDILSRIDSSKAPPTADHKSALALKHYAPLIYGAIRRAIEERGKQSKASADTQQVIKAANDASALVAEKLRSLGFSV